MEMINLTSVFEAALIFICTIITVFLIPWLKANIDASKLEKLMTVTSIAVKAAEQIYRETGMGAKKKAYVENYLAERGYKLDTNQLDVLIESAVKEMKIEMEEV